MVVCMQYVCMQKPWIKITPLWEEHLNIVKQQS